MRKLLAFTLLITAFGSNAQIKPGGSYKDYFQEGSYLLLEDNFIMATENFEAAYEIDSTNANINYFMGLCYLHSATHKAKAETFLAKAITDVSRTYKNDTYQEKSAPPLAHYYYGKALHINYKFDEATEQYDKFATYVSAKDKDWKKMLEREKQICAFAKEWVKVPINIQITNIGDSINSQYPDYSPVLSADERMMIFTTRRPNTTGGMRDLNGMFSEDVVVSYKDEMGNWSSPQPISANINSSGMEASINLTPDGQTLILYKDNGDGTNGNIYYSTYDGKDWSTLKEFGSDVNTKYWESHACLSHDGNVLFFVSDRPGGLGGRDIYRCVKLPNGKWSKALNMGPTINTEYDEDGAFIHPDGKTFFFASKGHQSMGGFDIMFATLNEENKFTDVANIGYPINTTDDDIFYVASPDGKRGYFSSAKEGGLGEKDIYMISIPQAMEKPLALFKGQIIPAAGESLPEDLMIVVHDKETGETIGVYRPKIVNGTFATILPPGKEYNFSYQSQGEEFYNEDVYVSNELSYNEIKREVNLEPVKLLGKIRAKQKAIILNALVFDNSSSRKPITGAIITLQETGGASQSFTTNISGKHEGIELQPDKKYTLFAEADGKKSQIGEVSTIGIKSGKVINQMVYMSGKPEKAVTPSEVALDVTVKSKKGRKPVANALITITDADGNKTEVTTDENGVAKGIPVTSGTKYTLTASKDGAVSEPMSFKAGKGTKRISKPISLETEATGEIAETKNSPAKYEFYFSYNKNQNDESEEWNNFVNHITELSKKKTVTVTIKASASKVPTRAYKNNHELATTRATKLQDKIKAAVESNGGNPSKIKFLKTATVGGPPYRGDHAINRERFEKHQYVKASAR